MWQDNAPEFFCSDITMNIAAPGIIRFVFLDGPEGLYVPKVTVLVPITVIPVARARLSTLLACTAALTMGGGAGSLLM